MGVKSAGCEGRAAPSWAEVRALAQVLGVLPLALVDDVVFCDTVENCQPRPHVGVSPSLQRTRRHEQVIALVRQSSTSDGILAWWRTS